MAGPCPIYLDSIINLNSTSSIIGNVPSSTGILILHGQNDSGSRVQHAFLLQQKLFELNHPDHTLITYPDLGHLSIRHTGGQQKVDPYLNMC
jgi:uncharacterized protein